MNLTFILGLFAATALAVSIPQDLEADYNATESHTLVPRKESFAYKSSTMSISTYILRNCQGDPMPHPNTQYSADYYPTNVLSYRLSRDQERGEQFDLSRFAPHYEPAACGLFIQARTNMKKGCHNAVRRASCFRFWHH